AAATWRQVGYWRNAETLWTRAVQATTDNPFALFCRGRVSYLHAQEKDDPELLAEAGSYFEHALVLDPDSTRCVGSLALVLVGQGRLDQASECLHKVLLHDPADLWALQTLGSVQRRQGHHEEAIRTFREVLRHNESLADVWAERGLAQWQLGRRD